MGLGFTNPKVLTAKFLHRVSKSNRRPTFIEEIILTQEQEEQLKSIETDMKKSPRMKEIYIRQVYGGRCLVCNHRPDYKLTFIYEGVTLIRRYCQPCFDRLPEVEKQVQEQAISVQT